MIKMHWVRHSSFGCVYSSNAWWNDCKVMNHLIFDTTINFNTMSWFIVINNNVRNQTSHLIVCEIHAPVYIRLYSWLFRHGQILEGSQHEMRLCVRMRWMIKTIRRVYTMYLRLVHTFPLASILVISFSSKIEWLALSYSIVFECEILNTAVWINKNNAVFRYDISAFFSFHSIPFYPFGFCFALNTSRKVVREVFHALFLFFSGFFLLK